MIQTAYLNYRSSQIHYAYSDTGTNPCICFHGYGESLSSFRFLDQYFAGTYRLIAIDMPLHGHTAWNEGEPVTIKDIIAIIEHLLNRHGHHTSHITLMGFSMGGRVCLSLLQAIPRQISKTILLAPDGLIINKWYWLATQTKMGNRLFAFTMRHPGWFRELLRIGRGMGIVNKSIYKFTRYYIQDNEACRQLYERWTCLATLTPDMEQIIQNIQQQNIHVHILYGEHDRIAKPQHSKKLQERAGSHCTVLVLPGGHQLLQEKNVQAILQCLTS